MQRQLGRIGFYDNAYDRYYLKQYLNEVLNDASTLVRRQSNGRDVRESLLTGPEGVLKMESIWEGRKLITVMLFGRGG